MLPPEMNPRGPRRPGRADYRRGGTSRLLTWVAVLASAAILVASTAGYVLVTYYNSQITRIGISNIPGFHPPSAGADGAAVNFLLVGSDTRSGAGNGGFNAAPGSSSYVTGARSDTQLLVHIPPGNGKITVISFPRDSLVQIPAFNGHQAQQNKLNAAFSFGGPSLLIATIEKLSGLRIDHYMEIDFAGFKNMVDALGGLTVCVQTSRHDVLSGDFLSAGVHHINGRQALAFVRDRHTFPDQDLSRIKDQQYFLSTMLKKVLSAGTLADPFKLNGFLSALAKSVTVDNGLSLQEMKNFAEQMRHLDPAHITFVTLPFLTSNYYVPGVGDAVELDPVKDAALFRSLKENLTPTGGSSAHHAAPAAKVPPGSFSLAVLNGSSIAGLAHRAAAVMTGKGFHVVQIGNAPGVGSASIVEYSTGHLAAARTVAAAVPGAVLRFDSAVGNTVQLVLGSGYQPAGTASPSAAKSPSAGAAGTSAANLSCAP